MGKNRHSKDKLYIIASEYQRDWGGHKKKSASAPFKCLPFNCCALSLSPFENPVCTKDGVVFDCANILPYIKQYKRNPVSAEPLCAKDLIPLKFTKEGENDYACPITSKVFNDNTAIVANAKSGYVYAAEAIENLCRRPRNWEDPITGEPFTSADLIMIQDPQDVGKRAIEQFHYIKSGLPVPPKKEVPVGIPTDECQGQAYINKTEAVEHIIEECAKEESDVRSRHNKLIPNARAPHVEQEDKPARAKHSFETTHRQAAGFTSTVVPWSGKQEFRDLNDRELREMVYEKVRAMKKKGYVRLVTSLGLLNIELHCDITPETCHNFILHCESGYYNSTIFFRCIKHFMIQGGDPSGSGKGGRSAFEGVKAFNDEFNPKLTHAGGGVLSMANSGKNTNKSQFFITFKSAEHLNDKHTVFGRVVGGLNVLKGMEDLETNDKDRPKNPPSVIETLVFSNPYAEAQQALEEKEKEREKPQENKRKVPDTAFFTDLGQSDKPDELQPAGKYIKSTLTTPSKSQQQTQPRNIRTSFNFAQW